MSIAGAREHLRKAQTHFLLLNERIRPEQLTLRQMVADELQHALAELTGPIVTDDRPIAGRCKKCEGEQAKATVAG